MLHANVPNVGNPCSTLQKLLIGLLSAFLMLSYPAFASAQDWKAALQAEQAKNAARISQIETDAAPLVAKLRQNTTAIDRHNAQHPDGQCTYPQGHPEVCTPWIEEASKLNTEKQNLVSQLQPLADESDRLIARNNEIERRLRCVPLPTPCTSDAQCNECSSCSTFDGSGKVGNCQPRP